MHDNLIPERDHGNTERPLARADVDVAAIKAVAHKKKNSKKNDKPYAANTGKPDLAADIDSALGLLDTLRAIARVGVNSSTDKEEEWIRRLNQAGRGTGERFRVAFERRALSRCAPNATDVVGRHGRLM